MAGHKSQGTTLKRGDGAATEVFTAIGGRVTQRGPDGQAQEIDVSDLDSAAVEVVPGLPDEGSVTLEGNFIGSDAQQQGLWDDRANGTERNFEIEFSDQPDGGSNPTKFEFSAYVLNFNTTAGVNNKLEFSVTLRITGAVTPTWAS